MTNNYKKLTEITVKSQGEFDMVPDVFEGIVYVEIDDHLLK